MANDKKKYVFIGKRKFLYIGIGVGILLALLAVGGFIAIRKNMGMHSNRDEKTEQMNQTDIETINQENETSNQSEENNQNKVSFILTKSNNWESSGSYYCQYDIVIANEEEANIKDWNAVIELPQGVKIEQIWNAQMETENQHLKLKPVDYNKTIQSHNKIEGIGFIMSATKEESLSTYQINITYDSGEIAVVDSSLETEITSASEHENKLNADTGMTSESDNEMEPSSQSTAGTYTTSAVGKLQVSGTSLMDSNGNQVQLKGVSTHGLAWFPQYVNYDTFATLKNDWGCNVVRVAMYASDYGGYCNGGDQEALKTLIDNGVSYATDLGMYVIIDWHILSDGNPQTHESDSIAFFNEMSAKYRDHNNVIYEICNEPVGVSWNDNIKPYAQNVLNTIRGNDSDAIVLVGTNNWSQNVDDVVGNRLDNDGNVMYVAHFYAGTHHEDIRNKIQTALDSGIPIFISECSITDASGNGGIDYESANTWLSFLNQNGISYVAWSLSNKNESSALINASCSELSGWSEDQLSETGKWFRMTIGGK